MKRVTKSTVERRELCCPIFIGDGDSTGFQLVRDTVSNNRVTIHKEECLVYVSKRVKKKLEGGPSYQSSSIGSEPFTKFTK